MIKFGLSKIGSPNILENTIHFWSAIYMHLIWPIILLEFFIPDLHFANLIGNAYITSEIVVYLYRAFNSSFISLHIETIYRQHSMSSISNIRCLLFQLPILLGILSYKIIDLFKDITKDLFTFCRNNSRCTNSSKCWFISTNLT